MLVEWVQCTSSWLVEIARKSNTKEITKSQLLLKYWEVMNLAHMGYVGNSIHAEIISPYYPSLHITQWTSKYIQLVPKDKPQSIQEQTLLLRGACSNYAPVTCNILAKFFLLLLKKSSLHSLSGKRCGIPVWDTTMHLSCTIWFADMT